MSHATTPPKRLAFFARYLTVWVFLCMIAGIVLGRLLPGVTAALSKIEFGHGSQVNVPIGVLLSLGLQFLQPDASVVSSGLAACLKSPEATLLLVLGLVLDSSEG